MEEIINNIMQSPENTNPNVLRSQLQKMGGGSSGGVAPFIIPVTVDANDNWTTTASASDVIANISNCAMQAGGQVVMVTSYLSGDGYSVGVFSSAITDPGGSGVQTTIITAIEDESVIVEHYTQDLASEQYVQTANEPFIVTCTPTNGEGTEGTVDKTDTEILAAINTGRSVYAMVSNNGQFYLPLTGYVVIPNNGETTRQFGFALSIPGSYTFAIQVLNGTYTS